MWMQVLCLGLLQNLKKMVDFVESDFESDFAEVGNMDYWNKCH